MGDLYRGRISEGMQVKSSDGEKIGKVVACQSTGFVVEKGLLFPKDLLVPYDRISSVGNGEVLLSLARTDLAPGAARTTAATARDTAAGLTEEAKGTARNLGREATERAGLDEFGKAGEVCVSLVEEELVTSKHVEKVGEVRVHKEVITEEKQISVPVTREVVRVERVPVTHEVRASDKPFEKETYDFPIREEHVTIEKRPVVREEVHVGKEIQQAEETASATVRRERAEVETMGSVRRAEATRGAGEIRAQAAPKR